MKKQIAFIVIAALLCSSLPCIASFSDVTSKNQSTAVGTLSSLGIVNGFPDGTFHPSESLKRSQFCKMAVTMLGSDSKLSQYKSYTIFPDVIHSHWAAGYINTAVLENKIISGFPNGTFRPDDFLTDAQAISICLRMLGYETADIGAMWPGDYIEKAKEVGLTEGLTINANQVMTRGRAAILLFNLLSCETKEKGSFLSAYISSSISENVFLINTSGTSEDLTDKQIEVALPSSKEKNQYTCASNIDNSVVGTKGTLVFDKNSTSAVIGFIPVNYTPNNVTVKSVQSNKIDTSSGEYAIPANMSVVLKDKVEKFSDCWYDILPGSCITIYKNKSGGMEYISCVSYSNSFNSTFVLMSDYTAGNNPLSSVIGNTADYTVYKNGSKVDISSLHKYDVISYDTASKTVNATDYKLSGILQDAYPSLQAPTSVKVLGQTFQVSPLAAITGKLGIGNSVTLLLSSSNSAAGILTEGFSGSQYGFLESYSASNITVTMLSTGIKISGTPAGNYEKLTGNLVTLYQNTGGKISVSSAKFQSGGTFNPDKNTLGSLLVSPNVSIYETADNNSLTTKIDKNDIKGSIIPGSHIVGYLKDSSGTVSTVILKNVTGNAYDFGLITTEKETIIDEDKKTTHTIMSYIVKTPKGSTTYERGGSLILESKSAFGGIAASSSGIAKSFIPLKNAGSASLTDFNGSKSVTLNGKALKLSDDVMVYIQKTGEFMSLNKAKSLFTKFEIYNTGDTLLFDSVRLILAS